MALFLRLGLCGFLLCSSFSWAAEHWDIAVVGDGPAGYSAAIEASRHGLRVLHLTGNGESGQISSTPFLDNWPGEPETIRGANLIAKLQQQAGHFPDLHTKQLWLESFERHPEGFALKADNQLFTASALILSPGAKPRIPEQLQEHFDSPDNTRIHTCITCDGPRYQNKEIAIIGGGNTAAEQALEMSRIATNVHLIYRSESMKALKSTQQALKGRANIHLHAHTTVDSITEQSSLFTHDNHQPALNLLLKTAESRTPFRLPVDGVFIATGQSPATGFVPGELTNQAGYLKRKSGSLPAGQCQPVALRNVHPFSLLQAAEGVKSAQSLRDSRQERGLSRQHSVTIIGSSVGAFTAALYAVRDGFDVTLIDKQEQPDSPDIFWPTTGNTDTTILKHKMVEQVVNAGVRLIPSDTHSAYRANTGQWLIHSPEGVIISDDLMTEECTTRLDLGSADSDHEGVFIAGDAVEDSVNQAITAAAAGIKAAMAAVKWLQSLQAN